MTAYLEQLSSAARHAVYRRDWPTVAACSREILSRDGASAEGRFLAGLALKATGRSGEAAAEFEHALALDPARYDAAMELANQYVGQRRHAAAAALVANHRDRLAASPVYLNLAGSVLASIGLQEEAWPLFASACELQPDVDLFESNLAACSVFVGRIDDARQRYRRLLERYPAHQRYHYQLSRLGTARDSAHIDEMEAVLRRGGEPPERNVFMYYALGKELEDLERWDEAFAYFQRAGDAVLRVADYDVEDDVALVDTVIETCSADWFDRQAPAAAVAGPAPIFIVGLPRSGTTLVDRVLSSHPDVASVGETQYLPMAIRDLSGVVSDRKMTPAMIRAVAGVPAADLATSYRERLDFRLGGDAFFIDKLPFNVLYLGFIAKAFPAARLVLLRRQPLDACFAMYKQVFTGAYKFSYAQDTLARFYLAYRRLVTHWQAVLGDRLVLLDYETLVADPDAEIRRLLEAAGIPFDPACLKFADNRSATATASAVQVREGMHTRSVGRWRRYANQLAPLRKQLESAGVDCA